MISTVRLSVLVVLSTIVLMGPLEIFAGERNGPAPAGPVSDEAAAIKIAITTLELVYEKEEIEQQKPYRAVLKGDVWHVSGSLRRGLKGGVVEAEIRKNDGHLINVWHGR